MNNNYRPEDLKPDFCEEMLEARKEMSQQEYMQEMLSDLVRQHQEGGGQQKVVDLPALLRENPPASYLETAGELQDVMRVSVVEIRKMAPFGLGDANVEEETPQESS